MTNPTVQEIVARVLAELQRTGAAAPTTNLQGTDQGRSPQGTDQDLVIDLPDPAERSIRRRLQVSDPMDPEGLRNLAESTPARLGVGRAGARPRTASHLLFEADHAVTQDAIYGVVSEELKEQFNLFTVTTRVADREEYLLRPDLGRQLNDEARQVLAQRCRPRPDVQICVADGLSAAAIENNLPDILPVIEQGLAAAGLSVGTPFFVANARVSVINDINAIIGAKVVLLLIGERPGLGIADAMSAYMGFDPQPGTTDADRDLICMITAHGGVNPLEAGAYVVEFIARMLRHQASGVKLREIAGAV